jgi:mannose-6-phosphate isomerase class I
VDESAWPGGAGYNRYGFDPAQVGAAASDQAFRREYLAAVEAYERVRRALDELPEGVAAGPALREQERQLRVAMDSFSHSRPLRAGDLVVVPPLQPHALQHGVRTVEFQTPVYERKILSFAQKVLTQEHWDTREALPQALLLPPDEQPFERLLQERGVLVERIVDFPDFEVRRVRLEGQAGLELKPVAEYALLMVIEGELALAGATYGAEQALLLPRGYSARLTPAKPAQPLVLLLATPRR